LGKSTIQYDITPGTRAIALQGKYTPYLLERYVDGTYTEIKGKEEEKC
jgi:hypothetical protein